MKARLLRPLCFLTLIAALLGACAPGATEAPPTQTAPPPAASPTRTAPPTATERPPTETPTAVPPSPTATFTPVPPTATFTPSPTPTPGPGDVVYRAEQTGDWDDWDDFFFGSERFVVEAEDAFLTFDIDGADTYVYSVFAPDWDYADVQVDAVVATLAGPNRNNLSVVCRYSDLGWYEFNILSGGLWTIYKWTEAAEYTELASGGSTAIKMNQAENHLTAVCAGSTLTFYINDVKVGAATDRELTAGSFGVSASTFDIGGLRVRFTDVVVRLPDPEAALGQGVAPTVAPQPTASGGGLDALFDVPLPGGSLAGPGLQLDTLSQVGFLFLMNAPDGCQDVRVTSTEVTEVTTPPTADAQGVFTTGEWTERWVVTACGQATPYRIRYWADGAGGFNFQAGRWT
jgi:hypothetical protein